MGELNKQYIYEVCGRCKGSGFGEEETCNICYGRGKILVKKPAKKCGACMGTGYACDPGNRGNCKVCGGSGWEKTIYPMKA